MSGSELQEECARRGLPSSRAAKAVMVQRLLDHDAENDSPSAQPYGEGGVLTPALTEAVNDSGAPEPVVGPPTAAPIRVFTKTFPAEPDGPDEETHLAYRQATLAAATDAGYQTRGDARLAAIRDGDWVYEASVRQAG